MKKEHVFHIPDYCRPGIYEIVNVKNGKSYIGSSINISRRAATHSSKLSDGKHHCKPLQEDYNRGCVFEFHIIKKVHTTFRKELRKQEMQEIHNRAKSKIYNVADAEKWSPIDQYATQNMLAEKLADLYCQEHFGTSFLNYIRGNIAKVDMCYQILFHPQKENEIRLKYAGIIDYLNKVEWYKNEFGVDYDEYIEIPKKIRPKLKRREYVKNIESIKAHAAAQGETVNGFIKRAIDEAMERDRREKE